MSASLVAPRQATLAELLRPWVDVVADDDRNMTGLSVDSAQAQPGDVFCALAGTRRHGLEFVDDALASKVSAVLAARAPAALLTRSAQICAKRNVPLIVLDRLNDELSAIAGRWYGEPSEKLKVIGVTGTDGKTSVSQFLAQALSAVGLRCGVIGTLGYGFVEALQPASHTTPDAVRVQALLAAICAAEGEAAAMEVSSHALDQGRVAGVHFDVAVLTNLSRDHLDYHGTVEAYAEAKARLFRQAGLGAAVLNRDDAFGRALQAQLEPRVSLLGYSLDPADTGADIVCSDLQLDGGGMRLRVRVGEETADLVLPLLGRFNAANVLATLAALQALGVPLSDSVHALQELKPVPGRMECFGGGDSPLVVVDYAHTPAALAAALAAVREHVVGRVWCVFGCGGDRDRGKRPEMGKVAAHQADGIVITDDNPRSEPAAQIVADIRRGLGRAPAHVEHDREQAIRWAVNRAENNDVVLVAGKGHEQEQQVGNKRIPFDDRVAVVKALQERVTCKR
ncbi:UDP-N-acetylmuramoyl-L-alanyl-D-glutamate--2,6-diaminopimelate ligase [Alkalilimnicola ehrlichii]|uniref:UDP-N-acetylmuramoyl-L-alanyl-D-glutamate--2,6-diaminopimelate ligase n=1 Tax=Alkalilimnicola ehrlichii TaxID=351052 RepID=A0A3E0X0W9_9GAMM|nr:UDP-N-acetylmuramoyl-L-alanyl-D-glutamate--2,6-diaminopimelate ligase [Alkalilimnicola ehrlichii]RFA30320.1 UDP-N-acetylmuramoyl-L-alanyl-D-glutamate--2,6-diaminopimelate ligase [Alkalilimnicola ehrlichii]RFA37895.1 UDP-N-acetylmuramoyl-L-alanyl-D-glutamate--2,6-diaminopimelate ligase [Alkalilimnicola ehrlichii]